MVQVQTEALGLSAEEVEQLVTVPLEADLLNGVAWLDEIRSESVPGLSSIEMIFEPGTDIFRARQMVQERLTQAHALPNVSKAPVMLEPLSSSNRVMMVGLSAKDLSLIEMSVLARWKIKPRLMGLPGVANVAVWGQRERQLQVQVDPQKMRDNQVTLSQVISTTGNAMWVSPLSFVEASTPGTGGFIDTSNQRLTVQHIQPITTPRHLSQIAIEETTGRTLRLADVANVVEDHQPLIGDAVVNDGPGLVLVVEKYPGANTVEVTKALEDALAAMRPGMQGIEVDTTLFRPATFIEKAVDNLTLVLIIGGLLIALVIGAFLRSWRTALISVVAIPLSLVTAALVVYGLGSTMNAMVLAGFVIAIGIVVDDAIVDVDNIARRLRERRATGDERSAVAIIVEASTQIRSPITWATVIAVTAVAPLFLLQGLTGSLLRPLAFSYLVAVLASMAVALTVTPALSLLLLSKAPLTQRREPALTRWLQRGYDAVLVPVIHRPRRAFVAVAAIGVIAVAGLAMLPGLGGFAGLGKATAVPSFQDRNLLIHWEGAPGTSRSEMQRITAQASRELRAIGGVRNVGAHIGRAITSDQVVGVNAGELWVSLHPGADYAATVAAVKNTIAAYPGMRHEVQTYPEAKTARLRSGTGRDLTVRVYGQDLDILQSKAEEVRSLVARVGGVVEPRTTIQAVEPTVQVEVDLSAAQRHGIKPGDVRRAAAALISGIEVGSLFDEQKVFEVVVWGSPDIRHSLTSIDEILIDTPGGGHVRLGDVAKVQIKPTPNVIRHDSVSRYVDVTADVRGRALDSVVGDVRDRIAGVKFPVEYHAEVLEENATYGGTTTTRGVVLAVTVAIAVFLLLQAAFASWRLAGLFFLALPLALIGGLAGILAAGSVVSFGAFVGLFTVLGLAVRNGVVLIDRYRQLELDGAETSRLDVVTRGARERLVSIVTTALATGLAVAPLAFIGNVAGHEVLYPMALVILGGLVTSTVFSLLLVPALYLFLGSSPTRVDPDLEFGEQPVLAGVTGGETRGNNG